MRRLLDRAALLALAPALLAAALPAAAQTSPRPAGWRQHDMSRPRPAVVTPAAGVAPAPPPVDAAVLFDGRDLAAWQAPNGGAAGWTVGDGWFEVKPGSGPIRTRAEFGDVQLHVEWASPSPPSGTGQNRANSGIFLMGRYEVQVLDSYRADTYADGQAGAVYGQHPPLANAARAPGEWQAYDVYFRRPRFAADGRVVEPARITVVHNGIVVQNNEEIRGPTSWLKTLPYEAHPERAPIELQDHGSPVRFRNLWVRELPQRAAPAAAYAGAIRPVPMSAAQLDRFVGVYDRGEGENAAPITVRREGSRLAANFFWRPGYLPMVPVSATEFALTDTDARVEFEVDAQGRPTALTFVIGGDRQRARRAR